MPAPVLYVIRINGNLGPTVLYAFPAWDRELPGSGDRWLPCWQVCRANPVTRRCRAQDPRPGTRPARSGDSLLLLKAACSRGQDH